MALVVGGSSAGGGSSSGYSFNGNGQPEHPNDGMMWAEAHAAGPAHQAFSNESPTYSTGGNSVTYHYSGKVMANRAMDDSTVAKTLYRTPPYSGYVFCLADPDPYSTESDTCGLTINTSSSRSVMASVFNPGGFACSDTWGCEAAEAWTRVTITSKDVYYIEGNTSCLTSATLYDAAEIAVEYDRLDEDNYYKFLNLIDGDSYRLVFSNGAYYDFTINANTTFDYDACIFVYGYTCGVDNIKLYIDDSGWVLDGSVGQSTGYDVYEMPIADGEDYKISFIDSTIDGDIVVHNQTFSCTGDHVLINFDRCNWVYPPNGPPVPMYLWTGYDYNIVVFKDAHGNLIENSQLAIYDQTDDQYIQRWTDAADGYTLLGTLFDTDHDVLISLRTFDGIFTLETTYPANGTAPVGEEVITTTNWTIPIKYNLNVLPVDQYGVSLFDVFCGLSEYTPLNPGAFWGMDLSDQGYVPVTNCSGFAMCDIIAEKEGYVDYRVEALNWTSKSALVKDYRHNVVMEEE